MLRMGNWCALAAIIGALLPALSARAQPNVPAGVFHAIEITPFLDSPVAMAFAADGRLFVAEKGGLVKVIQNNQVVSTFIDLRGEVNAGLDRGLLGLALDPNFLSNRRVYLFYAVDPIIGEPDESSFTATFSRLTRYEGTAASGGNVANPASRTVLIGATPAEGIPQCWQSHSTGALRFAPDGSLMLTHGDSARFGSVDSGSGSTPQCFAPGMFPGDQDIGAFRSQMLDSLAGKMLRLDPNTGNGLPGNPFYNAGAPGSTRSRIWASGLRNPFRFSHRPGTGDASSPGTFYIGDVGWDTFEELSVVRNGGENLGWPCAEGHDDFNGPYQEVDLREWDCDSIGTPSNPGLLTSSIVSIHHNNALLSQPPGLMGHCMVAGAFHTGNSYPSPWRGGMFFADFINGWIQVVRTNANDEVTGIFSFGSSSDGIVDFAIHPQTGDICLLTMFGGKAYRLHSLIGPGDVDRNDVVNVADLLLVISNWGPCPNPLTCPEDLNVSGQVDVADLLEVIANWG